MKKYALGIDIGATSAKVLLVTRRMRVVKKSIVPCDPSLPWRALLGKISDSAAVLCKGVQVSGAGIGFAGCVDRESGIVNHSPNMPRWNKVSLRGFMEGRLEMPCVLDNDVNMMTLGEFRYGAGRGAINLFCITIGTGVGGGLIIGGEIYRGVTMSAGEIGHVQVEPEGIPCPCGNRGCLERYVGKEGLILLARRAMRGRHTELKRQNRLSPLTIETAARKGDAAALDAWEKAGYYLGLGLVCVVNILNPDKIVIGGGISKAGKLLLKPARRVVRERALPGPARHVRIVLSAFGENAGAIGAASEAFKM